jgi:Tfp pilus assembly protein PilE
MWTAIVLIVIAAIAGEAWRHHVKARHAAPDRASLDELARRVEALDSDLRSRVETLERIVTDRQEDLKRQFDRLDKTG